MRAIRISREGLVEYVEVPSSLADEQEWMAEPNYQGRILDKFGTKEPYPVLLTKRAESQEREQRNDLATVLVVPASERGKFFITGDVLLVGVQDNDLTALPERVTVEDIIALTEFFADH